MGVRFFLSAVCVGALIASPAFGSISYTASGVPLSPETFNTLPNSGLPSAPGDQSLGNSPFGWADDTTSPASGQTSISGWYLYHPALQTEGGANGHQRLRVTYPSDVLLPDDGVTASIGSFYSFGNIVAGIPSPDRALGAIPAASLAANGGEIFFGMRLTNNTGLTLTEFTVNYTGEQWRVAASPTVPNQTLSLDYRLGGTDLQSGAFVEVPTGGFDSIVDSGAGTGLNGDLPANRQTGRGGTISNINWTSGTDLWVRWTQIQNVGADHGLAIDDVIFSASGAVPEPGALGMGAVAMLFALSRRIRRG